MKLDPNWDSHFDLWAEKYMPIPNQSPTATAPMECTNTGEIYYGYETFGGDQDFIVNSDHHYVWTLIEDDDIQYIVPGRRWANRIAYLITTIPWVNEEIEPVIYWVCPELEKELLND